MGAWSWCALESKQKTEPVILKKPAPHGAAAAGAALLAGRFWARSDIPASRAMPFCFCGRLARHAACANATDVRPSKLEPNGPPAQIFPAVAAISFDDWAAAPPRTGTQCSARPIAFTTRCGCPESGLTRRHPALQNGPSPSYFPTTRPWTLQAPAPLMHYHLPTALRCPITPC